MPQRVVSDVQDAPQRPGPATLAVRHIGAERHGALMDPFLNVDVFTMSGPAFPPHPHAGFSAITYILPESPTGFLNRDSLGNIGPILPGGLHWTTAGRGVMHEEFPLQAGLTALGLQIFVNLAAADKRMEPAALDITPDQVPVVESGGATVRVVLGRFCTTTSPLAVPTAVSLFDIQLAAGARLTIPVAADDNLFAYLVAGALAAPARAGGSGTTRIEAGQVAFAPAGAPDLTVTAGAEGARAIIFAGTPLREPVVTHGPFVAESREALMRTMDRWRLGEMGHLEPYHTVEAARA